MISKIHSRHGILPTHTRRHPLSAARRTIRLYSEEQHEPLRILFCGADEFSIHSLHALNTARLTHPTKIASIDVVCRPDKRTGRGLKYLSSPPIKSVAQSLSLPIHPLDTFKSWSPPHPVSLIIAVSFGLLVPARLLSAATYGGINLHPSLLPDLRGPAPIQHALLRGRKWTGVTVQTMHPTLFDRGMVIAQTEKPGVEVGEGETVEGLVGKLGVVGAEMLTRVVLDGEFVNVRGSERGVEGVGELGSYAPKITTADRRIEWEVWSAERIATYDRVLGRLWDEVTWQKCFPGKEMKRITFDGPWEVVDGEVAVHGHDAVEPGQVGLIHQSSTKDLRLVLRTADGLWVSPKAATVGGGSKGAALPQMIDALKHA